MSRFYVTWKSSDHYEDEPINYVYVSGTVVETIKGIANLDKWWYVEDPLRPQQRTVFSTREKAIRLIKAFAAEVGEWAERDYSTIWVGDKFIFAYADEDGLPCVCEIEARGVDP